MNMNIWKRKYPLTWTFRGHWTFSFFPYRPSLVSLTYLTLLTPFNFSTAQEAAPPAETTFMIHQESGKCVQANNESEMSGLQEQGLVRDQESLCANPLLEKSKENKSESLEMVTPSPAPDTSSSTDTGTDTGMATELDELADDNIVEMDSEEEFNNLNNPEENDLLPSHPSESDDIPLPLPLDSYSYNENQNEIIEEPLEDSPPASFVEPPENDSTLYNDHANEFDHDPGQDSFIENRDVEAEFPADPIDRNDQVDDFLDPGGDAPEEMMTPDFAPEGDYLSHDPWYEGPEVNMEEGSDPSSFEDLSNEEH